MSDAPKRVPIITPDGKFDTIGAEFADEVVKAGGRVLTKKEAEAKAADVAQKEAQARQDELYERQPTAVKVLGGINTALSVIGGPLTYGLGAAPGTHAQAYSAGVTEGLSGGLAPGLVRQGVDATLGHDAGDKYAQSVQDQRAAYPVVHGAGNLVGTAAGAVAPVGGVAENAVARGLARAGVQGTSALTRAGIAAAKLGVRGAVEGGLIGAGEEAGTELLQDHDLAADKIIAHGLTSAMFGGATGAVLGGGTSLVGSGLGRALGRSATEDARIVAKQVVDPATQIGETATRDEAIAARKALDDANAAYRSPTASPAAKNLANDLAADALGATKTQMSDALEHVGPDLATNKRAVGDYVNRIIQDHVGENAGAWAVGKVGRADDILGVIQQDQASRIAAGFDKALKTNPARFNVRELYDAARGMAIEMDRDPVRAAGAGAFWNRFETEWQALAKSGQQMPDGTFVRTVGDDLTMSAEEAFRLRSKLERNAYELSGSGAAQDAYKKLMRVWDGQILQSIDKAASEAGPSNVRQEILHWKREYQLSKAAEEMAKGGAERFLGNNTFGIREGIAGATAMMTGHPILGVLGPVGLKIAKERGKMVLANQLYQGAERSLLARLVSKTDEQIARASKGLLVAPEKGMAKASEVMPPPRQLATKALARIAAFQSDPDAYVDEATRQTEAMATHSPEIASALVAKQVQAMTFLQSKVPYQGEPDPLDPHPKINLTPTEEASLARYTWYTEKPARFFAEVARGKLTPEGAETAQALMPRAFEQLQAETFEALTTQLARGNKLPFRQRELLGQLLDFAATPAQRPEHRSFLQANVSDTPLPDPNAPKGPGPKKGRGAPSGMTGVPSALDRLESGGPGRRRT